MMQCVARLVISAVVVRHHSFCLALAVFWLSQTKVRAGRECMSLCVCLRVCSGGSFGSSDWTAVITTFLFIFCNCVPWVLSVFDSYDEEKCGCHTYTHRHPYKHDALDSSQRNVATYSVGHLQLIVAYSQGKELWMWHCVVQFYKLKCNKAKNCKISGNKAIKMICGLVIGLQLWNALKSANEKA